MRLFLRRVLIPMESNLMPLGGPDSHDFMGKNGFLWWIGVVEDRNDPLELGRARVRIFGTHHESTSVLPTSSLPWALALTPLNNASSPKSPPEASWVFGCFLDGQLCQQPLMLGVLPGYRTKTPNASTTKKSLPT